ncbi:hypothetical protein RFI_34612, partial [Reticulomyxa filosa]
MAIDLFETLIKCKDQIKVLIENQNFNDEKNFENTLSILSKSKCQKDQDLVTSLRPVNHIMQEKLWKCPLEDMANLAKSILSLHSNGQDFVTMIKKCCDIDLSTISTLVDEADKIRTGKSLKQLKEATQYGEWLFARKKQKELILKMGNATWYREEIGENIDRVLLGAGKEELKDIETVIQQFEECKEINSYRIEFWKKGGRIDIENDIENDEKGGSQNDNAFLKLP